MLTGGLIFFGICFLWASTEEIGTDIARALRLGKFSPQGQRAEENRQGTEFVLGMDWDHGVRP